MLVVEINEKDHNERPPNYENERQEHLENLVTTFIRTNPDKPGFDDYEVFGRVLTKKFLQVLTILNQLKSKLKN